MSKTDSVACVFGGAFKEYCDARGIRLQKVHRAFKVPSRDTLDEDIVQNYYSDLELMVRYLQNKCIKGSNTILSIDKELLMSQPAVGTAKRYKSCLAPIDLEKLKMQIFLRDSIQTIPTRLSEDMIESIKLNVALSGEDVFKTFERYVKEEDRPGLTSLKRELCTMLEDFRIRHRKFKYYSCLMAIMNKTQAINMGDGFEEFTRANIPTVNVEEIESFLINVVNTVVPRGLFGTVKNKRLLIWMLSAYINQPRNGRFDLGYHATHMKATQVPWLNHIHDKKLKVSIFKSMLLWFFKTYIDKLLHSLLIILTRNNKRVFVRRWDWYRLQRHFLRKQLKSKVLLDYKHETGWKPPKALYRLLPDMQFHDRFQRFTLKRVRPVVSYRYANKEERHNIGLVATYLRQLFEYKFGRGTVQEQWRLVKQQFGNGKVKIVTTDVKNAFGSIILEKLFAIITRFSERFPDNLQLVEIGRRDKNSNNIYKDDAISYKPFFADLPFPFSSRTLFVQNNNIKPVIIKKDWILEMTRRFIFQQRIFIGNRVYIVGKGVLQGIKLSPILSDIYYATLLQKKIEVNLDVPCKVIRYVDDTAFISNDASAAARFYRVTRLGLRAFGCNFNKKTYTNVTCAPPEKRDPYPKFLGMLIKSENLELLPDFPKVKDHPNPPFKTDSMRNIPFIIDRMRSPHYLKLPRIMLDSHINSDDRIEGNVRISLKDHRSCILHLIRQSFSNPIARRTADRLLMALTFYSMRNLRRIVIYILEGQVAPNPISTEKWMKTLIEIAFNAYEPVFKYLKKNSSA